MIAIGTFVLDDVSGYDQRIIINKPLTKEKILKPIGKERNTIKAVGSFRPKEEPNLYAL